MVSHGHQAVRLGPRYLSLIKGANVSVQDLRPQSQSRWAAIPGVSPRRTVMRFARCQNFVQGTCFLRGTPSLVPLSFVTRFFLRRKAFRSRSGLLLQIFLHFKKLVPTFVGTKLACNEFNNTLVWVGASCIFAHRFALLVAK